MLVRKAAPTVQLKVETRPDFQEHRGKKSPLLQVVVVWCGHVPVRNTEIPTVGRKDENESSSRAR